MKRYIVLFFACYSFSLFSQNYNKEDIRDYIEIYYSVAIKKMQEHKIPASITLAQGILESAAGKSELAIHANNHFGIKCHKSWTGKTYHKDDDAKNECFRQYKSPLESFEDHSQFLKADRYAKLFTLKITDYRGWAYELKKAGYATHPEYPQRLIRIIEEYNLTVYDQKDFSPALAENKHGKTDAKTEKESRSLFSKKEKTGRHTERNVLKQKQQQPESLQERQSTEFEAAIKEQYKGFSPVSYPYTLRTVYSNNGSYFIVAKEGDTFYEIAVDVQLGVGELKLYNDVPHRKYEPQPGEMIYLQRKKPYAEKQQHILKANETLRSVAQQYGCRLKSIYRINRLDKSTTVFEEGLQLQLRK
ncbi:MAG: glucosaminidase domain-containing protein [Bacteroidales bacterium]|jgi:LysM repeat protein|nr:glucosaminidase domain-containing protein [Bacteroidales bacterium]